MWLKLATSNDFTKTYPDRISPEG